MLSERKDNFGYRVSSFKSLGECEKMFELSQLWEFEQTEAMRNGKLFESYVFGFKDEEEKAKLEGRKKAVTLDALKEKALSLKTLLKGGVSWERLSANINGKIISGEPDYVGHVVVDGEEFKAIVDLKNTGDIFRVWDGLSTKFDYMQSIGYNWLRVKNGLSILPFVYLVNDSSAQDIIVRPIVINVTEKDIAWFNTLVEKYTSADFYECNPDRCKGRTYSEPQCKYITKCPYGRSLLTDTVTIDFSELSDPLEIKVNESNLFNKVNNSKPKEFNPQAMEQARDLKESDLDQLIKTGSASDIKEFTYFEDEFKDEPIKCRGCRTKTLKRGMDTCPNCKVQIKII